jgi:glycosyltransferase involved in cell wall biosynthesis
MTLHNYRLLCANAMLFREGRVCEDCIGTSPWRAVPHRCYRNSMFASAVAATAIDIPRRLGVWDDVDLFISLTEFARERFVAGGLPATKLLVKPNFVDDPGPRPNLPSTSNTVLFVGRLSTEKGVRTLLEAWHSSDLAGLELLVVGDGPLREELESTAPRGVRFAGRVAPERVSELMLRSRGMVFPSVWYEGQPMVLLEALAAGLPVVASDIGGIPETVAGHSVLVAPGDRTSWTRALERLADAEWVDSASAANRAVYESRYAPEVALGELEGAYRRAREERGLRP